MHEASGLFIIIYRFQDRIEENKRVLGWMVWSIVDHCYAVEISDLLLPDYFMDSGNHMCHPICIILNIINWTDSECGVLSGRYNSYF